MRTALDGTIVTKYTQGNFEYDVRVLFPRNKFTSASELGDVMLFPGGRGTAPVFLRDVADVRPAIGPTNINRENQNREMQLGLGPTKGKDADSSNVMGPWLVTADEVGDPQGLRMSLSVNGTELSSYNTSQMAWGFADLVSYLSRGQTLRPGHIVTSGCYPGGSALDLGTRLDRGDEVSLSIEKLGVLTNTIG